MAAIDGLLFARGRDCWSRNLITIRLNIYTRHALANPVVGVWSILFRTLFRVPGDGTVSRKSIEQLITEWREIEQSGPSTDVAKGTNT